MFATRNTPLRLRGTPATTTRRPPLQTREPSFTRMAGVARKGQTSHFPSAVSTVAENSAPVPRQNIWHNARRRFAECRLRLGDDVTRAACGATCAGVEDALLHPLFQNLQENRLDFQFPGWSILASRSKVQEASLQQIARRRSSEHTLVLPPMDWTCLVFRALLCVEAPRAALIS